MTVLIKDHQSFHAYSKVLRSAKLDAQKSASWILEKMDLLTPGNLKRINSIATNTCNLQRAVWDILSQNLRLQHALFIPCDSHGFQSLINDLLKLSSIAELFGKALKIVNTLRKAKHHLVIPRSHQITLYGQKRALIASNILRRGTQVDLMEFVAKSKEALRAYAFDPSAVFQPKKDKPLNPIKSYLLNPEFWSGLDDLIPIMRPIHEVQKMSEANNATFDQVYSRWLNLQNHINRSAAFSRFERDLHEYLALKLRQRLNKQLSPVHRAAHYLHPANIKKPLDILKQGEILASLRAHSRISEHAKVENEFYDFRERQNNFSPVQGAWENNDDPVLFWRKMVSLSLLTNML